MNATIQKIGLWAAIISLLSIAVWFVSFGAIAATQPLFNWTDAAGYFEYVREYSQFFQDLAKSFMLVFSLSFLVLQMSLYESFSAHNKFPGKIALVFMILFAAFSSLHYFIQISMVRLKIGQGQTGQLAPFLQADPLSFSTAMDMLGWTLMLGLGSLFMAIQCRLEGKKWLNIFHYLTALFCLAALTGYLLQYNPLTFISINMGVGACITAISVVGVRYFWK